VPIDRRRALVPWLAAAAAYTAFALIYTWPLATRLSSAFPHDAYDPSFGTWVLWWNAHVLPLTERWWNAPFFWPARGSLALAEHLLGISIVATPLQWIGLSPIEAYNAALFASFPLAALAAHLAAFSIVERHDAAAIAGLAFGFSLYRLAQLPHIQVLWSFGMPLALAAAHFYLKNGTRIWLGVFAAAWLTLALSNGYFLFFFPVLMALWVVWHTAVHRRRALAIAATWAVASLPLVPILLGYQRIQTSLNLGRTIGEIEMFSADITAIAAASADSVVWGRLSKFARPEGEFFPGIVVLGLVALGIAGKARRPDLEPVVERSRSRAIRTILALAALALAVVALSPMLAGSWRIGWGARTFVSVALPDKPLTIAMYLAGAVILTGPRLRTLRRHGSELSFYTLAAVLMYTLALGPRPRLSGTPVLFHAPYSALLALPGFGALRVPARLGTLFVLCLSIAAGVGFAALTARIDANRRSVLAAIAVLLIVFESWPVFRLMDAPKAIDALRREPRDEVVLELPLGLTERDVGALYRSIEHGHPVVNGYSGYQPPHYIVLQIALARGDWQVLDAVAGGRRMLVAIDHGEELNRWTALVSNHPRHQLVADDEKWRIFRIEPLPARTAGFSQRLAIASVSANVRAGDVNRVEDGQERTLWSAGQVQRGNEAFTIDLGQERTIDDVRLDLGPYVQDFPRGLEVDCAGENGEWSRCWQGSPARLAVAGILDDPPRAPMNIPINRPGVRRIRLKQTAVDPTSRWSIAELVVLGR
jgi:hypothetical protein